MAEVSSKGNPAALYGLSRHPNPPSPFFAIVEIDRRIQGAPLQLCGLALISHQTMLMVKALSNRSASPQPLSLSVTEGCDWPVSLSSNVSSSPPHAPCGAASYTHHHRTGSSSCSSRSSRRASVFDRSAPPPLAIMETLERPPAATEQAPTTTDGYVHAHAASLARWVGYRRPIERQASS